MFVVSSVVKDWIFGCFLFLGIVKDWIFMDVFGFLCC